MRDLDIRRALHQELRTLHFADPETLIIDELGLCQGEARVDIAVVNGSINGYEIKSDRDTLDRLPQQQEIYNRALDAVTIVVTGQRSERIADVVPSWWGILRASDAAQMVTLVPVREPGANPAVDPLALVQLLWRDEVLEALHQRGLANGISGKPRRVLWERLAGTISLVELKELVRSQLRARQNWPIAERRTPGGV